MAITLNDILEGTSTDQMQSVGNMQIIPIQGDDDDTFAPPNVNVRTSNYGDVHLENDEDRPTIVPPGSGWVVSQAAQNHAIGGGALIPAKSETHINTAMCIQQSQCGYVQKGKHPMMVLPAALRGQALSVKDKTEFGRLWGDIGRFNEGYDVRSNGHLENFLDKFKKEMDEFVAEFELVPNQIGAIILVGGKVVGVERAPSAAFWSTVWEPLIRVCYGSLALKAAKSAALATRSPLKLGVRTLSGLKSALLNARQSDLTLTKKIVDHVKSIPVILQKKPDSKMGDSYLTTAKAQSFTGQIVAKGTSKMKILYTSLCTAS